MNDSTHMTAPPEGPHNRVLPAVVTILVGVFVSWIWALPLIGHHILVSDDYYGLKRTPLFSSHDIDCDDLESKISEGEFLGIYPYRAILSVSCRRSSSDINQEKDTVEMEIRVQKPHTFFSTLTGKIFTDAISPAYERIFNETRPLHLKNKNQGDE